MYLHYCHPRDVFFPPSLQHQSHLLLTVESHVSCRKFCSHWCTFRLYWVILVTLIGFLIHNGGFFYNGEYPSFFLFSRIVSKWNVICNLFRDIENNSLAKVQLNSEKLSYKPYLKQLKLTLAKCKTSIKCCKSLGLLQEIITGKSE